MNENVQKVYETLKNNLSSVIVGKERVCELAVISLLCGGHMLLDDVPGTGKTVFAKTFAASLSLDFKRVQCVPDMLPSDLIGVNFFDMKLSEFRFIPGPVFTGILLADEVNRAMPKTQAGLLECMEERQVSVDGKTYPIPSPFMVIATQNPLETKGTFELPEAQLDRFLIKTDMGYPSHSENIEILRRKLNAADRPALTTVTADEVLAASRELEGIYVCGDILDYATTICESTRAGAEILLGVSPRALIHLLWVARGFAAIRGRDHVIPDDIKDAAIPVLSHRIVFRNSFGTDKNKAKTFIEKILESTPVPSEQIEFSRRA